MRRVIVVGACVAALVAANAAGPVSASPQAGPRSYVEDDRNFFTYITDSSESNCGGNPACDIQFVNFSVSKSDPTYFDVVVGMAGPTDANMIDTQKGSMVVYLDTNEARTGPEYALVTLQSPYPLMEAIASWVYAVDGSSWQKTEWVGYWLRSDQRWGAFIPWQDMGITALRAVVRVDTAQGQSDFAPASGYTPVIPIAALVAGGPGQPTSVTASAGMGQVTISWQPPSSVGSSAITSYTVSANPGGGTCTTSTTSCAVTGITAGTTYSFEVTATNAQGTGPASEVVSATPEGKVTPPGKVRELKTFSQPGEGQLLITWKPPVDMGGGEFKGYQVRVGKKPWTSKSLTLVVLSGLRVGQVLTVQVRAVSQGGPGPVSTVKGTVR